MPGCIRSGSAHTRADQHDADVLISLYDVKSRPTGRSNSFKQSGLMIELELNSLRNGCGNGGAYRDRTDDLLNANQALSQLS
jgi:hypothetical protein